MTSSPITSWQIDGETMETVADITLPTKIWIVIAVFFFFFRSHVWRWELNPKGWVLKNWCFGIVFLKTTLESPLDRKIKPINPKWNQPWIFLGRTETEAPILWPSDAKSGLIGKDPDVGKDWGQEQKRETENEMVEWLNGHEFEQTQGDMKDREAWCAAVYLKFMGSQIDTT